MAFKETVVDLGHQVMRNAHSLVVRLSGGRIGGTISDMPVLRVTTTGRSSGKPRTVMLTAPIHEDGRYVLVASKAGDDRDPDWYRNMVANPEITLEPVGSDAVQLVTRTATGEERDDLWPRIVEAYDGYEGYRSKTDREIPIVIAEPAG
ncbi:MAG: nitroreductase/quinone reductase family protein [Actinomycetota bacterium]